jgi:hypothetical protein
MKKSILLISVASLISTNVLAFSFSIPVINVEVKGDDPKVIVDVVEEAKRGGATLSNGVRDIIGWVGNTTGITNIIESNRKTLSDIGTGYACVATLCYSEVVKKRQLEEAEQEEREKYDHQIAELKKIHNRLFKGMRVATLTGAVRDSEILLSNLNQQYDIIKGLKSNYTATLTALKTQMTWNEAMARQGIKDRPALASAAVRPAVTAFEENIERDYESATIELEQNLAQLEKSTNRTRADLMSDFVYTLSDSTLRTFSSILENDQRRINEILVGSEADIRKVKAQFESAKANLLKEQD